MATASTEAAQEKTGKITARQLLAVLRQGKDAYMHGRALFGRDSWSDAFVFAFTAKGDGETRTTIEVPGSVRGGNTSATREHVSTSDGSKWLDYCEAYRPVRGFWSLFAATERLRDALESLPGDALVSFEVRLDEGTNEYLVRATGKMNFEPYAGLHCDSLCLVATFTSRGKERSRTFMLDRSTGPHNTARFGAPQHERDKVGRVD